MSRSEESGGDTVPRHFESRALTPALSVENTPDEDPLVVDNSRFGRTSSPPPGRRRSVSRESSSVSMAATPATGAAATGAAAAATTATLYAASIIAMTTMAASAFSDGYDSDSMEAGEAHLALASLADMRSVGRKIPVARPQGQVSLIVGGRRFVCETQLFLEHPETMLGRMFGAGAGAHLTYPNDNGDYVIGHDVSSSAFNAILGFYKNGKIMCPANVSVSELHEACNFFLVPFNHSSVSCDNYAKLLTEIANMGSRRQFEEFLDQKIMPAMARSAQLGERECHIVCLSDEDTVEWDDELPPALDDQMAQVIHSTHLFRFLKSHENRDIAKAILKEKGFKRIKVGIEGFPTYASRIRAGSDGANLEVVYNYEQRVFFKVNWEREDAKSRHVDFQCVRARAPVTIHNAASA